MTTPNFSWKILIIMVIILGVIGIAGYLRYKERTIATNIKTVVVSDGYKEHFFVERESRDLGFTKRAWRDILKSEDTLVKTANPMPLPEWVYVDTNERGEGIETWAVNNDTYEFKGSMINYPIVNQYSIYKNKVLIFQTRMDYGGDGPILQKTILNDKPGFTFRKSCGGEQFEVCEHEIYYDGKYMSKEFQVKNPRQLFMYEGKLGFIIQTETGDAIFFNGKIISKAYDKIHYMNCCSIMEILPTVYDNGVLLFYVVKTENKDYLIEIDLRNHL